MKICSGCKQSKPLEQFSLHSGFKDGRNSRCKVCKCSAQKSGYKAGLYKKVPYTYKAQLKQRYNLTIDQYEAMLESCNNCCQICGDSGKLNVDHCHETGVVRGLLCTRCNTGLGKFGNKGERLQKAIDYLEGKPTGS